jgi:hemoglobin
VDEPIYEQVGGDQFFTRLVDAFYDRVEFDEILRPMYPEDLTESRRHLTQFLIQYWGGPRNYQAERGHPRLRLRHAPFRITTSARDAWLSAMNDALDAVRADLTVKQVEELAAYFDMVARQLRNV